MCAGSQICAWTNRKANDTVPVTYQTVDWSGRSMGAATARVLPKYVAHFRTFVEYRARYLGAFNVVAALLSATLVLAACLSLSGLFAGGLLGLSMLCWLLPFATPATVELHGVARSIRIARAGALLLALIGLAILLLGCGPVTVRDPSPHDPMTSTPRRIALCDSGAFRITAGGVMVGREEFTIECRSTSIGVRVHSSVAVLGRPSDLLIELDLDTLLRPKEVIVSGTSGGENVTDTLILGSHTSVLRRGGRTRSIAAVPEASFVGANFHMGLWLAIGRYDLVQGAMQNVPVFPDQTMSVEPLDRAALREHGVIDPPPTGAPRAYRVTVGTTSAVAWLDARSRPVALIYQGTKLEAVREGTEFAGAVSHAVSSHAGARAHPTMHPGVVVRGARAEEIFFSVGPIRLAGTLLSPPGPGPFPAVVLISGSGPQDRDGALNLEGLAGYRPFRDLAAALVTRGVSVLRFDDRGVGKSDGGETADDLTTWDVVDDVNAAVRSLRDRKDIDPHRIGLLGHSEGALVALMVAAYDPEIAALVLLAPPGTRGDTLLRDQLEVKLESLPGLSPVAKDSARRAQEELFASLRQDTTTRARGLAWLRTFIDLNPSTPASRVHIPVGIFQGALDRQVLPHNADALARLLRRHAESDVTVVVFDSLNHLMLRARTGAVTEYATLLDRALGANLLDRLGGWLSRRLRARSEGGPAAH